MLWLPAAALFHIGGGQGATEVAQTVAERASILRFSRGIRNHVVGAVLGEGRPTEIEVMDDAVPQPSPEPEERADASDDSEAADPKDAADANLTPPTEPPLPSESLPEPEKPKSVEKEKPKEQEKPKEIAKEAPPEPPPPEPALVVPPTPPPPAALPNGRIAVQNDPTLDKNQPDNPDAARIADEANRTDEETQAANRSYDQNSPRPDGGGPANPSDEKTPGNGDDERRGHSVEAPGDGAPRAGTKAGERQPEASPVARSSRAPVERIGRAAVTETRGAAPVEGGKGERMPEAVASERGGYTLDPEGGDDRPKAEARGGRPGRKGLAALDGMILPGKLPTRYSVNAYGLRDALGAARLKAEAEHAHATRMDRHRGTMKGVDFRKYRAAIENYVPNVKEGNQTSLNAARVPFASYINRMHNQIHPIFADGFLASLSSHPDPRLRDMKLVTHVEIVLEGETGKLVAAGVVRPSGVTAFEVAALRSLEEASPFGKAPEVIVSPDGRVYVHWEFFRDPFFACTSQFARPYLLKGNGPAMPAEPDPVPTPPTPLPGPDALPGGPQKFGAR